MTTKVKCSGNFFGAKSSLASIAKDFDPDQPRDPNTGRWIISGTHVTHHLDEIMSEGFSLDKSGKWVSKFGRGVYIDTANREAFYTKQKGHKGRVETADVSAEVGNVATVDADKVSTYIASDPLTLLNTIPGFVEKRKELMDAYTEEYERRGGFAKSSEDDNFFDNWPSEIPQSRSVEPERVLMALGYDSLHVKQRRFTKAVGGDQWVIFDPSKVKWSRRAIMKRRVQPPGYIAETEKINENKKQHSGTVHKFTAAEWTHPNGHPRCLLCGQEESFSPECNREATPEERAAVIESWGFDSVVAKAGLPLWDGDGVQGAGQPRDRLGRWIALPGPTPLRSILVKKLPDGSYGIFKNRQKEPFKVFKTKKAANNFANKAIKDDANAYWEKHILPVERARYEADQKRKEEQQSSILAQAAAGMSLKPVPSKGQTPRRMPKMTTDETARLELPAVPNLDQRNKATAWANRSMPKNEAKYAGLIIRLAGKNITQDPKKRGEMSDKYGIPSKRLIEIEQQVYHQMFPQKAANAKRPNLAGGVSHITEQQIRSMRVHGARRGYPISGEESNNRWDKPPRVFKSTKGEHRGKWLIVSWNGNVEEIDGNEAQRMAGEGRLFWMNQKGAGIVAARKKEIARQKAEYEFMQEERRAQKERKIKVAQAWATEQGFDPNDSFWWAAFWNDSSLLLGQKTQDEIGDFSITHKVPLAEAEEKTHIDPKIMAHIFDLPDISSRDMRGHRPGPKKAIPGLDEDAKEASVEQRTDDPEWASRNLDRQFEHERRVKAAWETYKKKYPKSKKTFEEFKNDYYNQKLRIPGGSKSQLSKLFSEIIKKNPDWDGDGVQGRGQPRDSEGQWRRSGVSAPRAASGLWDSRRGTAVGLSVLPHQGLEDPSQKFGKMDPAKALYARNNGATKITDKRLGEIYESMFRPGSTAKPMTAAERNLLMSAGAREAHDGTSNVKTFVVRSRTFKQQKRFFVMNTIRKEVANREAKKGGAHAKGEGGQVVRRHDISSAKKIAENKKRRESGRNMVSKAFLQQMMDDFGDGDTAKCIFCGKPVRADQASPERMKPGPLGGKYERGNVAPSHIACNTKMGTFAQHQPDKYYDEMMKKFSSVYKAEIRRKKLNFVFGKNRGKLGKAPS